MCTILTSVHLPRRFKRLLLAGGCPRTPQLGHHHLKALLGSCYYAFVGVNERCARCICDTIFYYENRWCWDRWASLMHHPRCLLYEREEPIWSEYAAPLSRMGRLSRAGWETKINTSWQGYIVKLCCVSPRTYFAWSYHYHDVSWALYGTMGGDALGRFWVLVWFSSFAAQLAIAHSNTFVQLHTIDDVFSCLFGILASYSFRLQQYSTFMQMFRRGERRYKLYRTVYCGDGLF